MNARFAVMALSTWMLGACDLGEAERLDLTRGSSRHLEPRFQGVSLDGATDLVLTAVLSSSWNPSGSGRWTLAWEDLAPGVPTSQTWRIVGELDGAEVVRITGSGSYATSIRTSPEDAWIDRAEEVGLRLDSLRLEDFTWRPWLPDLSQRIRDDRPTLERAFSFAMADTRRRGDTLFVAVRNPGVNAIAVYSDYSGARQLGAYEFLVPPGGRDTLRWIVSGVASNEAWIDLGWGDWGSHERRSFRTP